MGLGRPRSPTRLDPPHARRVVDANRDDQVKIGEDVLSDSCIKDRLREREV